MSDYDSSDILEGLSAKNVKFKPIFNDEYLSETKGFDPIKGIIVFFIGLFLLFGSPSILIYSKNMFYGPLFYIVVGIVIFVLVIIGLSMILLGFFLPWGFFKIERNQSNLIIQKAFTKTTTPLVNIKTIALDFETPEKIINRYRYFIYTKSIIYITYRIRIDTGENIISLDKEIPYQFNKNLILGLDTQIKNDVARFLKALGFR